MNNNNYKVAVEMLIETLEFHMEGYQMGTYDDEPDEWIHTIINSVRQRIKVVRKLKED